MRFFSFLMFFFVFNLCSAVNLQRIYPVPDWVNRIDYKESILKDNNGFQYLLFDLQDNLNEQTRFRQYVVKVLNNEGIQDLSDISINFDPSYQKLHLHAVEIIREGKIINKINDSSIKTIQREDSMERSIYDGSLSTVINLSDVRKNDIIKYSYSIIGFNPVNNGNYSATFYQQYTFPVNRIYNRIVTKSKNLQFKNYSGALDPEIDESKGYVEYLWNTAALDFISYENNVPSWYNMHRKVSVSTFNSWKSVVDWALPLYSFDENNINRLKKSLNMTETGDLKILKLIRFVQDDIRYLGFEAGIGAYKPNKPTKVFKQRYGDCKDKSLLLIALLRSEGLSAFPLFINTDLQHETSNQTPSNNAFDHCVVYFKYKGKEFFIDPTISNQGGKLENISFPNYKKGLLIRPNEKDLIDLPINTSSSLNIKELISVDSIGGNAKLIVKSEYSGSRADYMRSYFKNNSNETIQKEYLNYYSSLYPDIELFEDIKVKDEYRNQINKINIEEHYLINNFWKNSDDEKSIYCEIYPLVLESEISYPKSSKRDMPFYLGNPYLFTQVTEINLPEDWPNDDYEATVEGDGFYYNNSIKTLNNKILINHKYELKKSFVPAEYTTDFIDKHEKIEQELPYYLTYNSNLSKFKLSWITILLVLTSLTLAFIFAIKVFNNFNPKPWEFAEGESIGGWLILPAIGLTITPLVLLSQIINKEHFNQNSWMVILDSDMEQKLSFILFFGAEIVFNFMFFVFSVLLVVLFYKKRTSLPIIISVFYAVNFIVPLIDLYIVNELVPDLNDELFDETTSKDLIRSFIAAAIWIPYFNISKRVKSTFNRTKI